jgi:hypothetical protein
VVDNIDGDLTCLSGSVNWLVVLQRLGKTTLFRSALMTPPKSYGCMMSFGRRRDKLVTILSRRQTMGSPNITDSPAERFRNWILRKHGLEVSTETAQEWLDELVGFFQRVSRWAEEDRKRSRDRERDQENKVRKAVGDGEP